MTKTKTRPMTITELSRVTGVSGASITVLVKKWKLRPTKTGEYNRKYYSAKDCQRIIDYYKSKPKTAPKTATKDEIIQALRDQIEEQKKQLDVKDNQIAEMGEQLKMAQINLSQSQQLQLQQAEQVKRLEAPQDATGDVVSTSASQNRESTQDEKTAHRTGESAQGKDQKRPLWARIFGKKKKIKF